MAERLRRRNPGVRGVERAIRRELKEAIETVEERWPPSDEAVHETRKRLKRSRAALRLIRPSLGERAYRRENRALRDAARPLSQVRDATAIFQAGKSLMKRRASTNGGARLAPNHASALRELLAGDRRRTRERALGNSGRRDTIVSTLRTARECIDVAKLQEHGWSALGPGLRRVYRSARRAFAAARTEPTPTRMHEWRKQTKYLWHVLEMFEPVSPRELEKLGECLHDLSNQLGEDHDLVVLGRRLSQERARIAAAARKEVLDAIDHRRLELRAKAMALGAGLYEEKPRAFERRLERDWRKWRG
jgi:CHAD domain-containing protein